MAPQPKVLLLDEPLSALDYKLRKDMQIELKRLQHETGITFIFVTHDQEEALTMSDRIAVMRKGKILQIGGPRDIYDRPAERFVADFIGETNFLDGNVEFREQGRRPKSPSMAATRWPRGSGGLYSVRATSPLLSGRNMRTSQRQRQRRDIAGTVDNVVYFGTDTHYHMQLDGGVAIHRAPAEHATSERATTAATMSASLIDADAAQVLKD